MERLAFRVLTAIDAVANRLYGSRWNPLYQSGTIVVALYLTILVTGLWLILFYRVATPWESVASLTANPCARDSTAKRAQSGDSPTRTFALFTTSDTRAMWTLS